MMKRITALALALLLLMSASSVLAETASWLTDTSPIKLKAYFDRPIDSSLLASSWGVEPVSKVWISETNIDVEWDYAIDDSHTKLNMLIAAGDYPDVLFCKPSYEMLIDLADNDIIWKLNELEKTAAPGFIDNHMSQNTILYVRELFGTMDIFALPTQSWKVEDMSDPNVISCYTGAMVLKSVYEGIGSPDMSTLDGFLDGLRKVKETYPNMIPVQASRNPGKDGDGNPRCIFKLLPFFDLVGNYYYDEEDACYKKYWYSDNFKELLKFVNTLYNEGLMDPTELTDSGEQMQAKLFNGRIFCNMNNDANNIDWFNNELANAGVDDEWIFIEQPCINTEKGYTNDALGGGIGDCCAVIFKNDKSVRAMQWLDYLMQEKAQNEISCGVQGLTWEFDENGVATVFEEYKSLPSTEAKAVWGISLYFFLSQASVAGSIRTKTACTEAQANALNFMSKYYHDYSFITTSRPENFDANSEETKIKANVKEYWEPAVLQMIMCKPDQLDALYEEALEKIASLGQGKIDKAIADYFANKNAIYEKYGADLDLSYLGL